MTSQRAGHEPVCLVPDGAFSPACALLEFTKAPAHNLRVFNSADIGTTIPSLYLLDIAA